LPFSAFRGGFAAPELCAARLQFALCGVLRLARVGFPVLRSVLAVVGGFLFCRPWFSSVRVLWRSVLPSVMILSRLARFDRFRLAVCGFHHASVMPSVFARFRLFSALVGFPLPLIVSRLFQAVFGVLCVVRLYFSSYRRLCVAVNLL